jgi:hypothetical protein
MNKYNLTKYLNLIMNYLIKILKLLMKGKNYNLDIIVWFPYFLFKKNLIYYFVNKTLDAK